MCLFFQRPKQIRHHNQVVANSYNQPQDVELQHGKLPPTTTTTTLNNPKTNLNQKSNPKHNPPKLCRPLSDFYNLKQRNLKTKTSGKPKKLVAQSMARRSQLSLKLAGAGTHLVLGAVASARKAAIDRIRCRVARTIFVDDAVRLFLFEHLQFRRQKLNSR